MGLLPGFCSYHQDQGSVLLSCCCSWLVGTARTPELCERVGSAGSDGFHWLSSSADEGTGHPVTAAYPAVIQCSVQLLVLN